MQILELNDLSLTLYSSQGAVIRSEPAATASHNGELIFGHGALARSRISPQLFNSRYLGNPAAQVLPSPIGAAHNLADLIYHHLRDYPVEEPLAVLTPSHFSNEQLGLFLGICQELGIKIRGFVDLGLVQSLAAPLESDYHFIDIEWHRLTLSQLQARDGHLSVVGHRVWEGRGLNHLLEGWMGVVADQFMQRTRFDPLHRGDTEQQLFQQTYAWLKDGLNLRVSIQGADSDRDLDVEVERLKDKTQQRLEGLDFDPDTPLLLSDRVKGIPFLADNLKRIHDRVAEADSDRSLKSYLSEVCQELPQDAVTRLSTTRIRRHPDQVSAITPIPALSSSTTHLLDADYMAHPVAAFDLANRPQPGEQVRLNDQTYTAIAVT